MQTAMLITLVCFTLSFFSFVEGSFVSVASVGTNAETVAGRTALWQRFMGKKDEWFVDENADEEEDGLVTKEMFLRDMLRDPKEVKRKKKGSSSYRTMDNRDALPFLVKVVTPDPYTPFAEKKREAIQNTKRDMEKRKSKNKKGIKRQNLLGMEQSGIAASLYTQNNDGSLQRILGEFQLDKSTNCGDIISVGEKEFEVQKARCQYKYAGGKRFVMVRKILEVKDVSRVADEELLLRQLRSSDSLDDSQPPPLE